MEQPLDQQLSALMRRQHGAFSQRQAVGLGFKDAAISNRFTRGRYRLLLPGVGVGHGTPDTWELRAMAALLWADGDAALAGRSAARAHGWELPAPPVDAVHLLSQRRTLNRIDGVILHRSSSFDPDRDTRRVGPLRCTAPARTIVDLAAELASPELRKATAQALRRGQVDAASLSVALIRAGRVRGAGVLRGIIAELSPLHGACRSYLESAFVDLTAGTGLEPSAMNHPVRDARGDRRRLDVVYLPEHQPFELDGRGTHSTVLDVADDQDREAQLLHVAPWRPIVRLTYDDVVNRGDATLARVEAVLRRAGSDRRWSRPPHLVC